MQHGLRQIPDGVPRDAPCNAEIGFAVPDRYNASAILFDNLIAGSHRPAVIGPAGSRTYGELAADAVAFGAGLLSLGLQRGDRVLLFLDDTPAYPAAVFGAIRAGLVPLLINTLTPPDLLQFYLSDSGATVAICDAAFVYRFNAEACRDTNLKTVLVVNGAATASGPIATQSADEWLARPSGRLPPADTHRDDMAFWMYSSGSTGRPKGIVHLQHDMLLHAPVVRPPPAAAEAGRHLLLGAQDLLRLRLRQLDHLSLLRRRLERAAAGPAQAGRHFRLHRALPPHGLLRLADPLHRAHQIRGSRRPPTCRACVSPYRPPRSSRPTCSTAGRPCRASRSWRGSAPARCCTSICRTRPQTKKLGAAGKRVPGYEIRLEDSQGKAVADGEEGILWVRGDSNAPVYWNRPDKTAETMREGGWIYTGDRFVRDADGFHFFRGRADDLVKVSGQWVYPLEVELALADHPIGARVRGGSPSKAPTASPCSRPSSSSTPAQAQPSRPPRSCRTTSRRACCPTSTRASSPSSTSCPKPAPARSTARPCSDWKRSPPP